MLFTCLPPGVGMFDRTRLARLLPGFCLAVAMSAAPAAAAQQSHAPPATMHKGGPAAAAQHDGTLTATDHDIGRLETRILHFPQALGVVVSMMRGPTQDVECSGSCFFPNSSAGTGWKCGPARTCHLYCTVNPPAGGCD